MKLTAQLVKATVVASLGGLLFGFDTAVIAGTTAALTAVYALAAGGAVKIVRYAGNKWHGPFDVQGIPSASWAAVGETP